jgi:putative peptide zinc metalloprotease protein
VILGLPELRQDLALHSAPPNVDGSPCWHLHDPAANKFYQIGWVAFEILSRWHLKDPQRIVESVCNETTLEIDIDDVQSLTIFLDRHHLFAATEASHTARLEQMRLAKRMKWGKWLLHNYLFFRVPLVRPDAWLGRWCGFIKPFLSVKFWFLMAALALGGLFLVARQWDLFLHGFSDYTGPEKFIAFALALSIAKVAHEMGHALVAKYHHCKVPTMGVAFLVLWPVLYTDTNEAWKLPSNRARFQIAMAGMAAELCVAVFATWLWVLLPESPAKAAALFIATTSWITTLALNASPFMRFDGYFLLVDSLGMPNLHPRAFALGRWWMREKLFALGDEPPEILSPKRHKALIAFAFATWTYRFVLFISIALLVYFMFFKLLGILLLLVEIGWFLIRPVAMEVEEWWKRRNGISWNPTTRRTAIVVSVLALALVIPWQTEVSVPASLAAHMEQNIYAPHAARVLQYPAQGMNEVKKGQVLLELESPDLQHRLKLAQIGEATLRARLEQQAFSDSLLEQGDVIKRRWEEALAQSQGLEEQFSKLTLKAQFDGQIVMRSEDLATGAWVTSRERLLVIADPRKSTIEAMVSESDLDRLKIGNSARFVPEVTELGARQCRIVDIERVNLAVIEDIDLVSAHGGPIPSRLDRNGQAVPVSPIFKVRLGDCIPSAGHTARLRGTAHLGGEGRSYLIYGMRQLVAVLIRESGF